MPLISAISPINIDILYSGLPRIPNLGEEVVSKEFDLQIGGGPPASLITLKKLGLDVLLGTFFSDDNMSFVGKMLLKQNDIDYINFYNGCESAVNVTSIASFPEDRYFLTYFSKINANILSDEDVYLFFKGSKVIFGLAGHNEALKRLKDEGTVIVYDVGWSDDLSIGKLKDILKYIDVFTPNDKEALKMTGRSSILEALDIIGSYVKSVIITLGKNGCIAKADREIIYCPPVKGLNSVDTTGAGDNFLAGIMYGLYHGWSIDRCMKMGNAVGGFSTTALGCCKAEITIEKAIELMNRIGNVIINPSEEFLMKF